MTKMKPSSNLDLLLLKECAESYKISDTLLGLENIVKRIEEGVISQNSNIIRFPSTSKHSMFIEFMTKQMEILK